MPKVLANSSEVLALGQELLTVLPFLLIIERFRSTTGPGEAVDAARRIGRGMRERNRTRRAILRRAILWTDRRLFSESNCYRRVLLEIALDKGAAREKVMMGFREGGGAGSGHAWLESDPPVMSYDAVVSL